MKGEIGHAAELKKAIAIKEEEAKKQHGPKKGRGSKGKKPRRGLPDKKGRGKPKGPPAGDGPALPEAFQAGVRHYPEHQAHQYAPVVETGHLVAMSVASFMFNFAGFCP